MSIDGNALPAASAYHVRVALPELSSREILQAVAEYDRLGQDRFLTKYGFGAARSYRLVVDGKTYDSKAIVGAAYGFLPGQEALTARLARQNILDRTGAPQLWCILDENVLHRPIGGAKVMRSQLYRLAEVAEHPRTTIQIIRSGGACIEVGTANPAVAVRDSKDQDGPQLAFTPATWQAFTNQLKASA